MQWGCRKLRQMVVFLLIAFVAQSVVAPGSRAEDTLGDSEETRIEVLRIDEERTIVSQLPWGEQLLWFDGQAVRCVTWQSSRCGWPKHSGWHEISFLNTWPLDAGETRMSFDSDPIGLVPKGGKALSKREEIQGLPIISALPDRLVAINQGELFQWQEAAWVSVGMMPTGAALDGLMLEDVQQLAMAGDTLCLLVPQIAPEGKMALLCFNPGSEVPTVVRDIGIEAIVTYREDALLAYRDGAVYVYDCLTGTLERWLTEVDAPTRTSASFVYDAHGDRLIFLHDGNLYMRPMEAAAEPTLLLAVPVSEEAMDGHAVGVGTYRKHRVMALLPLPGDRLCVALAIDCSERQAQFLDRGALLILPMRTAGPAVQTLRLGNRFFQESDLPFLLTRPDVELRCSLPESEWEEVDVRNYLFSEQLSDVVWVNSRGSVQLLIDNGLASELSDVPSLVALSDRYMPQVRRILSPAGRPMGLATSVSYQLWSYDRPGWADMNMAPPDTVDALLALMADWPKRFPDGAGPSLLDDCDAYGDTRTTLWQILTQQYGAERTAAEEPIRFDTPAYRALLADIAALPDPGNTGWEVLLRGSWVYSLYYGGLQAPDESEFGENHYRMLPPRLYEEDPHYDAMFTACVIPVNAQSPDVAKDYMTFLVEYMARYAQNHLYEITGGATGEDTPEVTMLNRDGELVKIAQAELDTYAALVPHLVMAPDVATALAGYPDEWERSGLTLPWIEPEEGQRVMDVDMLVFVMDRLAQDAEW